jgi:hypothetical protein
MTLSILKHLMMIRTRNGRGSPDQKKTPTGLLIRREKKFIAGRDNRMRSRKLDNCDKNPEIFVHLSNINEFFRS